MKEITKEKVSMEDGDKLPPSYVITGDKLLQFAQGKLPVLLDPFLPKSGLAALVGGSDAGKSTLLRQLCLAVVLEKETFLGFKLEPVHNSAIYVSTEDDKEALSFLIKKQLCHEKYTEEQAKRVRFIVETDNVIQKLDDELSRQAADVVVIDAFADLFSGNINQTNEVRRFLKPYSTLAMKYKCCFIFLHHTGKRTEFGEPSKNSILGSQGFEAKMRVVLELRPERSTDFRHLCVLKGNYLGKDVKSKSYKLELDSETLTLKNTSERTDLRSIKAAQEDDLIKMEVGRLFRAGKSVRKIAKSLQKDLNWEGSHMKVQRILDELKEAGELYLYVVNESTQSERVESY